MVLPRGKKLIAIAIGVLLGGLPLIGFNLWLAVLIERQAIEHVVISANRSIGIIDARLNQVAAGLDVLANRAVDSCGPEQRDVLRTVAFDSAAVKELALLGSDGRTLCSSLDVPIDASGTLDRDARAEAGGLVVEVVRVGSGTLLRMRRSLASGNWLTALVPVDLLLPLTASQGGPFAAWVRLTTRDGAFITEGGTPLPPQLSPSAVLSTSAQSAPFGITAQTTIPRTTQEGRNLWVVGSVVNGVVLVGIVLLGWLLTRQRADHPIAEIERALAANQFIPYFQPIVDITSARLLGAEVLVRWRKPDGSIIAPAAFVPLLEQSGLVMEMTRKLMQKVCVEIGPAYALRPHLTVSFNLTAAHFTDDAVIADLRGIFEKCPIRLSQVVLELTERQPLRNPTATRRVIASLQGLGCRVALDDVGTGHSGLSSILRLGVDIIKIDKMFIDSISNERNSATIIETLVDLARNMRMHVVAEGVEDFQQVADLRNRGITAAQGYLFAPPLPATSFLALLEAIDPIPAEGADDRRSVRLAG